MKYRTLGRTGLRVSEIAFGCGEIAGLMPNATTSERLAAIAQAIDGGITYFDVAPRYGNGRAEQNLGDALKRLGARPTIATKVALAWEDFADIKAAVSRSVEGSLDRLGVDTIDVIQLHDRVGVQRQAKAEVGQGVLVGVDDVLDPGGVLGAFDDLRRQGKIRFVGLGTFRNEMPALDRIIAAGQFDTLLTHYSVLNPSAVVAGTGFDGRDYQGVMRRAVDQDMAIVAMRALEAGVLSGAPGTHPLPSEGTPSWHEYRAQRLPAESLREALESDGGTMAQGAIRFVLSQKLVSTAVIGFSSRSQVNDAIAASQLGPFSQSTLEHIEWVRRGGFPTK